MFKSQLKTLSVIVLSSLIISQSYSADDSKKVDVSESTFKCLSALAASGRFFVDNILGDLDATQTVQVGCMQEHTHMTSVWCCLLQGVGLLWLA